MPKSAFAAGSSAGTLKKLFSGTAVLTLSAILTKLLGLVYRVPLIALVGTEGMAYFLAANHIYVLLFVISTAGLPVAVAVTVAEAVARGERGTVKNAYRTAVTLFGGVGLVASAGMMVGAGAIARAVGIPEARLCIVAIAPAVAMSCVSGALRGYLQGHQVMLHTAVSQLLEAVGKLVLGLLGAHAARAAGLGAEHIAAGAIFGITLGVAASMLYLLAAKVMFDRRSYGVAEASQGRERRVLGKLMRLALPVTLSSAVISLGGVIDTALISKSLVAAGFTVKQAHTVFSCYGNMAVPLFSLVPALISPVAMTLVPLVSAARERGDEEGESSAVATALRLTLFLALPASLGLATFSGPILSLIFSSDSAAAQTAAPLLSLLAIAIVPACLITVTNAVLQAKDRAGNTIISMLCGTAVKLIAELVLLRRSQINIFGAPISTILCNVTIVAINLHVLIRHSRPPQGFWRAVIMTAICAVVSVGGAGLVWSRMRQGPTLAAVGVIALAAVCYFIAALLCGVINTSELLSKGRDKNGNGQTTKNGVSAEPGAL